MNILVSHFPEKKNKNNNYHQQQQQQTFLSFFFDKLDYNLKMYLLLLLYIWISKSHIFTYNCGDQHCMQTKRKRGWGNNCNSTTNSPQPHIPNNGVSGMPNEACQHIFFFLSFFCSSFFSFFSKLLDTWMKAGMNGYDIPQTYLCACVFLCSWVAATATAAVVTIVAYLVTASNIKNISRALERQKTQSFTSTLQLFYCCCCCSCCWYC